MPEETLNDLVPQTLLPAYEKRIADLETNLSKLTAELERLKNKHEISMAAEDTAKSIAGVESSQLDDEVFEGLTQSPPNAASDAPSDMRDDEVDAMKDDHSDTQDKRNNQAEDDNSPSAKIRASQYPVSEIYTTQNWVDFNVKTKESDGYTYYALEVFNGFRKATKSSSNTAAQETNSHPLVLRVQSWPLLTILAEKGLLINLIDYEPIIMTHPFKWLYHYGHEIQARYKALRNKPSNVKIPELDTMSENADKGGNHPPTPTDTSATTATEQGSSEDDKPVLEIGKAKRKSLADMLKDDGFRFDGFGSGGYRSGCTCAECLPKHTPKFLETEESIGDLEKLVNFIDDHVTPKKAITHNLASIVTITFADLWYIFQPGVDICTEAYRDQEVMADPISLDEEGHRNHTIWRVFATTGGFWYPDESSLSSTQSTNKHSASPGHWEALQIKAYCIDFNASRYGAVETEFRIEAFSGVRDLSSLSILPLDSIKGSSSIRTKLSQNARLLEPYWKRNRIQHQYYDGRGFVPRYGREHKDVIKCHSEDIDSPVIVDISLAAQEYPDWTGDRQLGYVEPFDPTSNDTSSSYPPFSITLRWYEDATAKKDGKQPVARTESWFTGNDENTTVETLPGYGEKSEFSLRDTYENFKTLDPSDHILLPSKVWAYVLRIRRFAIIELASLSPLQKNVTSFDSLVIPKKHRDAVLAVVGDHFFQKDGPAVESSNTHASATNGKNSHDTDIVRGKGRGRVILLHGAPGVGKTSTAECVAQHYGKPLLPITCADLGTNAQEVEVALDRMFNYAYRWDCILLLDEADVFLALRGAADIQRNSLVSVFLRVLEYYRGILFLTTNRVGHFDDAFKSRLHLILHYKPLTAKASDQIWRMNIKHLTRSSNEPPQGSYSQSRSITCESEEVKLILVQVKEHFETTEAAGRRWNARQIRNALRTAISLAHFERDKQSNGDSEARHAKLQLGHVKQVIGMSDNFDEYLKTTHNNATESDMAFRRHDRNDDFGRSALLPAGGPKHRSPSPNPMVTRPINLAQQAQYGYGQPGAEARPTSNHFGNPNFGGAAKAGFFPSPNSQMSHPMTFSNQDPAFAGPNSTTNYPDTPASYDPDWDD